LLLTALKLGLHRRAPSRGWFPLEGIGSKEFTYIQPRPDSRIKEARKKGELSFEGKPRDTTRFIISILEGAILIARTYEDSDRFKTAARQLLAKLAPPARRPARGDMSQ
jgi:hypothetical protein